jgi:hypothetical protein
MHLQQQLGQHIERGGQGEKQREQAGLEGDELPDGIVNLRLTKCEMIQYKVFKKVMTTIYCSHVRL